MIYRTRVGYQTISPFTFLAILLMLVLAFFVALPLFLAALVVFGAVGAYLSWKANHLMKKMAREMDKKEESIYISIDKDTQVIDITPDKGKL